MRIPPAKAIEILDKFEQESGIRPDLFQASLVLRAYLIGLEEGKKPVRESLAEGAD